MTDKAFMTAREDMILYRMHMEGKNRHEIRTALRRGIQLVKDSYERQGLIAIPTPKKREKKIIRERIELTPEQKADLIKPRVKDAAQVKKINYEKGDIKVVSDAMNALAKRAAFKHGAYYLDGKLVTVLHILEAANAVLAKAGEPLIGYKHSQWRQ